MGSRMAFGAPTSAGACVAKWILVSLPVPAHAKVQRCGVAMTFLGQGECPLPVWQWQGGVVPAGVCSLTAACR